MSLPGFTAEASLDRAEELYYAVGEIKISSSIIVPAIPCCSACGEVCAKCDTCCHPVIDPHPVYHFTAYTPNYCHRLFPEVHFTPPYCVDKCRFCIDCWYNCSPSC